jgi:dTDP-4-amino-4,6-dideoxygalactose transaminase
MIPLIKPDVPPVEAWAPYLTKSYEANIFSNYGPLACQLIDQIDQDYNCPSKTSLPVCNATAGLQIALQALGKPNAKVVSQSFTFPATINAILGAGMRPILMDVTDKNWLIDPEILDVLLSKDPEIAAVMIVRTLGLCSDIGDIEAVCSKHDVPLIVDSAGCFGGFESSGRKVGMAGIAEVFSFHATKPFSVGEAGLIYGDSEFIKKCKISSNFGLDGTTVKSFGTNAKMSEVAAAISLARLKDFHKDVVQPRTERAKMYQKFLGNFENMKFPMDVGHPTWQFFPVCLRNLETADTCVNELNKQGYIVRGYYRPAIHLTEYYNNLEQFGELNVTEQLAQRIIVLPLHSHIDEAHIRKITSTIINVSEM